MALNYGGDLYTAINTSSVTSLLDTYLTAPAIFVDAYMAPQGFTGDEFINFYLSEPLNFNHGFMEITRTAACHSRTAIGSMTMALAVKDAVNRVAIDDGHMYCEVLATIPPADDTDVYNTPVVIRIKAE